MRRFILYFTFFVFSMSGEAEAEVVDIEEVIPQISLQDSIIKRFTVELDQVYYYSECNSDYLAITTEDNDNSSVTIFDWEKRIQTIDNVYFSSFLPGLNGYCVYSSNRDFTYNYEIFDFSGKLLDSFAGIWSYLTPGGKYMYTKATIESWRPLKIHERNTDQFYEFPMNGAYLASALSDNLMMIVEDRYISLWDLNNKSIAWKIDIPDTSFYIDDSFDILFSPDRRLALIRNMNVSYFVDKGGEIVWSNYDYNGGYKIAISSSDTLVSFVSGGYSHLVFILYSISGLKMSESDSYVGPDLAGVNVIDNTTYVNDRFQLAGFAARDINTSEQLFVTGICAKIDGEYKVFAIDGLWFYLEGDDREGTLVGFRNGQSEIVGYSVILK